MGQTPPTIGSRRDMTMGHRVSWLLREIQKGALDGSTSISDLLRKCVALGGAAGSPRLIEWASAELTGYKGTIELPSYRKVSAPLLIDGITGWQQITRQHIAPSALPKFVHEHITEEVEFKHGVGTLEEFAAQQGDAVLISPPGSAELIRYWNQEQNSDTQSVHRLYWSVSKSEVVGILHQIRNRLVQLIAEFEIEYDSGAPAEQAVERAVQITMGDGGNLAIVSSDRGSSSGVEIGTTKSPLDEPKWTVGRKIWAAAVGSAGIAGAIFAYMALPR